MKSIALTPSTSFVFNKKCHSLLKDDAKNGAKIDFYSVRIQKNKL